MNIVEDAPTPEVERNVETPVATEVEGVPLRVADRCDSSDCPQQARLRLKVPSSIEGETLQLLFCKHCFEKHETGLVASGAIILEDIRGQLAKRPANVNGV